VASDEEQYALVARYLGYAKQAAENARKTSDVQTREDYLKLEKNWLQLIDELTEAAKRRLHLRVSGPEMMCGVTATREVFRPGPKPR
jgi:hypothetical protein